MHDLTVLSPHRDDAAFSLFLALSEWYKRGVKLRVVNFFTQSAYAPYTPHEGILAISAIRKREDRQVLRSIGESIIVTDAGLLDAPMRYRMETSKVCELTTGSRIEEQELKTLSARIRIDSRGAVLAPLALGDHVDHRAVQLAACSAIEANRLGFYEDLPYATWTSTAALQRNVANLESLTGRKLRPIVMRAQHAVFRKRRLVSRYRSQIAFPEAAAMAQWSGNFRRGERLWIPDHSRLWRALFS